MLSRTTIASAAALTLSLVAVSPGLAADASVWRLFVADHLKPEISVYDLSAGDRLASFEVTSPARVYAGPGKEVVYAVQGKAGLVTAFATGLAIDDHGDHADLEVKGAPSLLIDVLTGDTPVHFVPHGGDIAVFFDGEGSTKVFAEPTVLAGAPVADVFASARPHHGVAAVFEDHILLSEPVPDTDAALPDWMRVLDRSGTQKGEPHACPGMHGEAASGGSMAFGCASGVLVFSRGASGPQSRLLPYPAGFPEGRTGTLKGGTAFEFFLGNYGSRAVVLIDPSVSDPYRLIELAGPAITFTLDPVRVKYAYVLGFDGTLHELDVLSGVLTRSVKVTSPYSTEGGHGTARPALALAGGEIAIADPAAGKVHLVDAESLTVTRAIETGGAPYSLAAVGGELAEH